MGRADFCVFENEWYSAVLSERVAQGLLSGCVVVGVVPTLFRGECELVGALALMMRNRESYVE